MRIYLSLLVMIFALHSCGLVEDRFGRLPEGSTTTTSFVFDREGDYSTQALELYGGIAIYLVGTNGNGFSTNLWLRDKFDRREITVPNGSYRVYAVGWEGDNSGPCATPTPCAPAQNQARCSDPNMPVVNMTGGITNVALNMSTGHCDFANPSVFSPGQATLTNFKSKNLSLCDPSSSPWPANCFTPTPARDVAIELVIYKKNGGAFTVLEGDTKRLECLNNVSNGASASAVRLPTGNPSHADQPFAVRLRLYGNASGCTGAIFGEYLFGLGLAGYSAAPGIATTKLDYLNGGAGNPALLKFK